ncbi:MAG: TonB-dependent receptor [Sphingopyxis sp.]|nr:TonB-dependent receptor [Sphingopyxis sp.]
MSQLLISAGLGISVAPAAFAEETPVSAEADAAGFSGEIVVTANRREQDITSIPYNISAIGADQLAATGVQSVADLAQQVPGLAINSAGGRYVSVQTPIIRGLNASSSARNFAYGQAPVTTYLGNVAVNGYFPVDDVARVEVLRGPQGTLYGGGSLGGALRLIPNDPKIGEFEGYVGIRAALVSHSRDWDRSVNGLVNIPLGDTAALRVSGKIEHSAGFIDQSGIMQTQGNAVSAPVLADPSDVAGSSAVYYDKLDVNYNKNRSVRASLLWEPSSDFKIVAAYNFSRDTGEGGPVDNPNYAGGTSSVDPRITFPATGEYQQVNNVREPYSRSSHLGSLDMSYDAGFATLSTTTSYFDSAGDYVNDSTFGYLSLPPAYLAYYIGNPFNPRFVAMSRRNDSTKTFVQEVRLVSNGSNTIDYVVGLYYENSRQRKDLNYFGPGTTEQTTAAGSPVLTGPNGEFAPYLTSSRFREVAAFGEVTWNISPRFQLTGGGRVFSQRFSSNLDFILYPFGLAEQSDAKTKVTDAIFKVNASYEFADYNRVYATFSQGFRRGGTNAFATTGIFAEPAELSAYTPDTVDNYEVGVKGRLGGGLSYTVSLFYDNWKNPQIDSFTPVNVWYAVINGSKARSKGIEIEASGPIGGGFSFSAGYALADAKFTDAFCAPVGNGGGGVLPCGISGDKGTRLPGSPKHSGAANLNYETDISPGFQFDATVNVNYRGSVYNNLPGAIGTYLHPDYWLVNASAGWTHGPLRFSVFAENLFDKRASLGVDLRTSPLVIGLSRRETIISPRSVGAKVQFNF